ncbi:MAG: response regulator transcription factor [Spirochaetales bacterium]|nr:response regulator transcription factor [Spirochaetales bacterium]
MKILLIDDHQMFREGLTAFILKQKAEWAVSHVPSINKGIEELSRNDFDIILSDYHLPGKSLKDLADYLKDRKKEIPLLIISMDSEISPIIKSLKYGAMGFIPKESSSFKVIEAIEGVLKGELIFDQVTTVEIVSFLIQKSHRFEKKSRLPLKGLSQREEEIFFHLVDEKSLTEISATLLISKKTVENHRSNIYRKLGVFDRNSLQEFAGSHDLN